jgi:UDP-N-acetylmuramate dehydrogenase
MVSDENLLKLTEWLFEKGIPFQEKVEIARLSQIKAGGVFRVLVKPETEPQLAALLHELASRSLPYKVIGNLSNVLFRDGEIRTIGISTRGLRSLSFENNGTVTAEAGVMLPTLARKLVQAGSKGFSGLIGVPASVGGAVYMNASCYGDATSDYLVDVRCVDQAGNTHVFSKEDLNFSWRHSAFHDLFSGYIIMAARFRPVSGNKEVETRREEKIKSHRRTYQENNLPNLGSTFATSDIYGDLARHFHSYRIGLVFIKVLTRIMGGDGHHRFATLARWFTKAYFHLKASSAINFSDSTFNCVVNRGGAKADEIMEFVLTAHNAINKCVPLEIELVKDIE